MTVAVQLARAGVCALGAGDVLTLLIAVVAAQLLVRHEGSAEPQWRNLAELLALVDGVRDGRARERERVGQELGRRLEVRRASGCSQQHDARGRRRHFGQSHRRNGLRQRMCGWTASEQAAESATEYHINTLKNQAQLSRRKPADPFNEH